MSQGSIENLVDLEPVLCLVCETNPVQLMAMGKFRGEEAHVVFVCRECYDRYATDAGGE